MQSTHRIHTEMQSYVCIPSTCYLEVVVDEDALDIQAHVLAVLIEHVCSELPRKCRRYKKQRLELNLLTKKFSTDISTRNNLKNSQTKISVQNDRVCE